MAPRQKFKSYTKTKSIVHAELTNGEENQLQVTLGLCKLHKKRGYSAI